ncbi:MAG: DNA replication and repair protein RecF [Oscillospiraceae bacterium]|nr:DNA replication and repair protein RecF [Oscillospiraceae bacterium]
MYIKRIIINGFKNLKQIDFSPGKSFNIIYGQNAQGKTNILEAIWISTGCRSFRNSKEKDYICFDGDEFDIKIIFQDELRTQEINYRMVRKSLKNKLITLNGVVQKNSSRLFENFKCIAFLPDDIDLIKGTPDRRRSFTDLCYSQLKPKSMSYIRKYDQLIAQRNAVIKNIILGKDSEESLDLWDRQLAVAGSYISFMRNQYVIKLSKYCQELYSKIAGGKETLSVSYQSNIFPSDFEYPESPDTSMTEIYYNKLKKSISDDLRLGYTHTGVGRDDISLKINNLSVKDYGSQGQQKSTALVMRLAQAQIYSDEKLESPVILLDDVMGELDENRQRFVCSIIADMQVFITTCNHKAVIPECDSIFEMHGGRIVN